MTTALRWTWVRFEDLGVDDLYDALALRAQVFVVEQGAYLDPDGLDRYSWHLLGRKDTGELIAYLRVVDPGNKYAEPAIGRVGVLSAERRGGVGRRLMAQGLQRADALWPGQGQRISAQAHLQAFYAELGFETVTAPYLEDDIAHVEMLRTAQAEREGAP